ncbi:MAG: DUF3035 domain-containing protein, partial [Thalassobaculaceae bacterium]
MTYRLPMIVSALLVAAGLVSGCAEVRDAAGLAKKSPDEFQVMARPPLSLPPNFTLAPPRPGAPRPQTGSADQQAKAKILGRAPQSQPTKPAPANLSAGESALYSALALGSVTDEIRRTVDQETTGYVYERRYLIDKILDWIEDRPPGIPVDAAKERRRLNENKAQGKSVTDGETPRIERRPRNRLQK